MVQTGGVHMFWEVISSYGFNDLWQMKSIMLTLVIAIIYLLLTGKLRYRFPKSRPVKFYKKLLFLLGLWIGYVILGGPFRILGSYLFSVHMLGMALLYFVVPPLIYLGMPDWLIRPIFQIESVKKVVNILNRPWIIVVVFNALVSFYHFPVIFDYFAANPGYGMVVRTLILIGAFSMWWNILCPVPEIDIFSDLQKLGYILLNVILLYPVCVVIMFSSSIMFETYRDVTQLFEFLPSLEDQRAGGVLMNIIQEFTLAIILLPIVYRWVKRHRILHHTVDPLPTIKNGQDKRE